MFLDNEQDNSQIRLESLPLEVLIRVMKHLDLFSLLALASSAKFYNDFVHDQSSDIRLLPLTLKFKRHLAKTYLPIPRDVNLKIGRQADELDALDPFKEYLINFKQLPKTARAYFHACASGDLAAIKLMHAKNISPYPYNDKNGMNVMHWAVAKGRMNVICYLAELYPELLQSITEDGKTLLHTAASAGEHKVVNYLLNKTNPKPDLEAQDDNSRTPLYCAGEGGDLMTFQLLVTAGASLNCYQRRRRVNSSFPFSEPPFRIISMLCMLNKHEIMSYLIRKQLIDTISIPGNDQMPTLLIALQFGKVKIAEEVLKFGSLNLALPVYSNLLALIIKSDSKDLLLLAFSNEQLQIPSKKALLQIFHDAIWRCSIPTLEILLIHEKILTQINEVYEDKTALHVAARRNSKEIIKLLHLKGANLNQVTSEGTPLCVSSTSGNLEACQQLLSLGADVNLKSAEGLSPCALALDKFHLQLMILFSSKGIKPLADEINLPNISVALLRLTAIENAEKELKRLTVVNEPIDNAYDNCFEFFKESNQLTHLIKYFSLIFSREACWFDYNNLPLLKALISMPAVYSLCALPQGQELSYLQDSIVSGKKLPELNLEADPIFQYYNALKKTRNYLRAQSASADDQRERSITYANLLIAVIEIIFEADKDLTVITKLALLLQNIVHQLNSEPKVIKDEIEIRSLSAQLYPEYEAIKNMFNDGTKNETIILSILRFMAKMMQAIGNEKFEMPGLRKPLRERQINAKEFFASLDPLILLIMPDWGSFCSNVELNSLLLESVKKFEGSLLSDQSSGANLQPKRDSDDSDSSDESSRDTSPFAGRRMSP